MRLGSDSLRFDQEKVSERVDVPFEIVSRRKQSEHKRKLPPMVIAK